MQVERLEKPHRCSQTQHHTHRSVVAHGFNAAAPVTELVPQLNITVASPLLGTPPTQEQMTVPTTALTNGMEMVKPT